MTVEQKAIEQMEQKLHKWTALVDSCQAGSCGEAYAKQKLAVCRVILDALLEKEERNRQ